MNFFVGEQLHRGYARLAICGEIDGLLIVWTSHGNGVLVPRRGEGKFGRLHFSRTPEEHDGIFKFAFVLLEVFDSFKADRDHRPSHGTLGAGRPSAGRQGKRLFFGRKDATGSGTARPAIRDGPVLEVRVGKAGRFELRFGPMAGSVEIWRASQIG